LSKRSLSAIRGLVALHTRFLPIWSILGRKLSMLTVAFPSLEAFFYEEKIELTTALNTLGSNQHKTAVLKAISGLPQASRFTCRLWPQLIWNSFALCSNASSKNGEVLESIFLNKYIVIIFNFHRNGVHSGSWVA
jgi:hypothetical protein